MSRRFGRQQKRKLRARVAELEWRLQCERERGQRNAEIVKDTADLLGQHFCTLDPTDVQLTHLHELGEAWRHDRETRPHTVCDDNDAMLVDVAMDALFLPLLKCHPAVTDLSDAVHFKFSYEGRANSYAVTRNKVTRAGRAAIAKNVGRFVERFITLELERST